MHSFVPRAHASSLVSLLILASPLAALGQNVYWNVQSGTWPTLANWVDSSNNPVASLPETSDTGNYFLTNGTSGNIATTTSSATRQMDTLTVGAYNILNITGSGSGSFRTDGPFTNDGTISLSGATTSFVINQDTAIDGTAYNRGLIEGVSGNPRLFLSSGFGLDNTGGTIVARNGAVFNIRTVNTVSPRNSILGGTLRTEAGGTIEVGVYDAVNELRLNNVTVQNLGNFNTVQSFRSNTGSRNVTTYLVGATTFTNNGLTLIQNSGTQTSTSATAHNAQMEVGGTASFNNLGTLRVTNTAARTTTGFMTQDSSFRVTSATATFASTGTIEVFNDSIQAQKSNFSSVISILNEGTVHVRSSGLVGGGTSHFTITGDGNSYTQSGTGLRTLLENGGTLTAPAVYIESGSLGGVGTVSGTVSIGGNGVLIMGETLAGGLGAGELGIVGSLTLQDDSSLRFGVGDSTLTSGRLGLDGASSMFIGNNVTLDFVDLAIQEGVIYRLIELDTGLITGNFNVGSLPAGWNANLSGGNGQNFLDVEFTLVPEPGVAGLLLVVTLGAGLLRRRR
jgi:hypothetical protein